MFLAKEKEAKKMENVISCNLETISALVLWCKENGTDLEQTLIKLYPLSINDIEPSNWAKELLETTIVSTNEEKQICIENGIKYIFVASLKDKNYLNSLQEKIVQKLQ